MNDPWSSPYRWVMLGLLWLIYMCFGIITRSLYPLVTPILADLQISYSQMGLIMGSWQLTYIGAATIVGFVIDRIEQWAAAFRMRSFLLRYLLVSAMDPSQSGGSVSGSRDSMRAIMSLEAGSSGLKERAFWNLARAGWKSLDR